MSKKLSYDYNTEPNRWIISYADFVTMLLALFIGMYAVSQMDIAQKAEFINTLKKNFSVKKTNVEKKKKRLTNIFSETKARIMSLPIESTAKEQIEDLQEKLQKAQEQITRDVIELNNLRDILSTNLPQGDDIELLTSGAGLTIRFQDRILFDPGSAELKQEAIPTLNKIAQSLEKLNKYVRIEGHTDNQPIQTSQYPSNWELSTARSTSVVKYFIEKHKFPATKISASGYGKYKPISTNTTTEGRQNNRRVDIVIMSNSSEIFEPAANLKNN